MAHEFPQPFARNYESLLKRLKLRGMQPKTIEAYSHGVRRAGAHFDYRIDDLSKGQLTDYFALILDQLSWSTLKHDLYGLKFYYAYVLDKPWPGAELTKAPKVSRLPDIVTVEQMQRIVDATRVLSYSTAQTASCGELHMLRQADADCAHAGEMRGGCITQPGTDQGDCHVNRHTPKPAAISRCGQTHPENG